MITRRDVIKGIALTGTNYTTALANNKTSQPNILLIYTDQHADWTLDCYGGELLKTPNIDSIALNGARLTNYFTNCAICTHSRGCFMTGLYPHSNGAIKNHDPLFKNIKTFGHTMKDLGYETSYIGKWHLAGTDKPGFIDDTQYWL